MKTRESTCVLALSAGLLLFAVCAFATATYKYKKGEYVTVEKGMSPDRHNSVAAHGDGDYGGDNFHLYLMKEPGHSRIGPLEEVNEILDTAPDAYHAAWAPDSRHVALMYRADRHVGTIALYRVENNRAFPIPVLTLVQPAAPGFHLKDFNFYSGYVTLKWLSASRFQLSERADYIHIPAKAVATVTSAVGKFGKLTREEAAPDLGEIPYRLTFSGEAVCELTSSGKYRVVTIKPGKFEDL